MEVLPCSEVQYVRESDCPQDSAEANFIYDGDSNCIEHGEKVPLADGKMDKSLLNADGCQKAKQGEGEGEGEGEGKGDEKVHELPTSGHCSGALYFDCEVEDKKQPCNSLYFGDDNLNVQNGCTELCFASNSSHLIVDAIESEVLSNDGEGELSVSEPKWLELDETMALWVKWRGKWLAGIRCSRADCPLSTLKAKPTHDWKKYVVVFFPHSRNHSWVDVLLVRPINECPLPIAHKTHDVGLEMVKDLTIARRFIIQKLAVGMLHIGDQLHIEALTENVRNVSSWKEFAMEASHCKEYSHLSRMLPRLQSMILMNYISPDWVKNSFQSWVERCHSADSAEYVEILKEELTNSILWNEVNSLWDVPEQPELGSEWKAWKHEVMKWVSTYPISAGGDIKQQNSDSALTSSLQINRKRPKLEVRRAEASASLVETGGLNQSVTVDIDSGFFDSRDTVHDTPASEPFKEEDFVESAVTTNSPSSAADRWNELIVESGNPELFQTKDLEVTPMSRVIAEKSLDSGNKNRQCTAFIEAKGRQCVRWANDGDMYCCVHLTSRFVGNSAKADVAPPVDLPLCEGTTTLGTRCKHRSLYGSSFCKKHRPQSETKKTSTSPENKLKRKHEENIAVSENTQCRDIVLAGEVENPLQVDPISVVKGGNFESKHSLIENTEYSSKAYTSTEVLHCIGSTAEDGGVPCLEGPKRHSLYCDKHLPSWLKRARNGKSRIISKEVFTDLLRICCSAKQKLQLHQACELFYRLVKSIMSLRNPVPREVQFQWALSEASKDSGVGEFLTKLVCSEKDKLMRLWGFNADTDVKLSSSVMEGALPVPVTTVSRVDTEKTIKCKICSEKFPDDQTLGTHWMDNHKKESQWLFRGYACAICLDSFTNRKVLESHVQDRHHVQFVEQCMLFQCIPCGSHFGNTEQLWLHVISVHPVDFRLSTIGQEHSVSAGEDSPQKLEFGTSASLENHPEGQGGFRRFICRFCGLKFDLLPDLGRHHQAAHMGPNLVSSRPGKKGVRYYAYRLKSGRLSHPRFKKGLGAASFKMRNRNTANTKKRIQASTLASSEMLRAASHETEPVSLGRLVESHCSDVAKILLSEIQKTRPRPSNLDILSIVRSTCCKVNLQALLEEKYGVLPERLYLKAAKLCSEHNIQVSWHQDGFVCPNGCKPVSDVDLPSLLMPHPNGSISHGSTLLDPVSEEWEMDECHYVIDSRHFGNALSQKDIVVCDDMSFGQESVPVACVVDEDLLDSLHLLADGSDGQISRCPMPWESFTYVTKPLLDQSLDVDAESWQLGCACLHSTTCCPEGCDHVYLFDNDYSDAKDIYGKPMSGRFPYDEKGRIILEEGYLVYECNGKCSCNRTCQNRVLQNGVQVKLEVFRTEEKCWAVRAGQPIPRGTFVCEYIGEVLSEQEADKRGNRYGEDGCSYFFDIDSHINDMGRLVEGQVPYVIDATRYGNVSRFINHSCSPNLVNHQVLVESMECQLAHIGLFANRDIALGEEVTYGYRYKLLPGEGYPCLCGASNCRGRVH